MLKTLVPDYKKVNVTTDDNRLRSILTTDKTKKLPKFFFLI